MDLMPQQAACDNRRQSQRLFLQASERGGQEEITFLPVGGLAARKVGKHEHAYMAYFHAGDFDWYWHPETQAQADEKGNTARRSEENTQ